MNRELEAIIAAAHMVSTLARPDLTRRVRRAVERGELVALLPGVYVRPGTSLDAVARARAITLADPAAVVCGAWAARLTFWPDLPEPKDLTVAVTRRFDPRPGFEFVRRRVPRSLTRRMPDYRVTARALTALDLVDEFGGDAIDTALRSGATLAQLKGAFAATTRRPGNALRRDLLEESRDVSPTCGWRSRSTATPRTPAIPHSCATVCATCARASETGRSTGSLRSWC